VGSSYVFYHVYELMPLLVANYEAPYPLKRIVLSASIGASLFQGYLALLDSLFKKEKFFYGYVSRKWLTIDETKKLSEAVTAMPWWVSIILLYIIAVTSSVL